MKLLIYEDDQAFASQLSTLFGDFGFKTLMASMDGEVQEIISNNAIDLFIIRAEVSSLSGYMLIKKLRTMDRYKSAPILLVSSKGTDAVFENHKKLEHSASYYLQLPAEPEMILAVSNTIFPFLPDDTDDAESSTSADTSELEDVITALSTENDELQESMKHLENRIKELNTDLETMAKAKPVEDENKKIVALEQKVAEDQLFIEDLEKKVSDLENMSSSSSDADEKLKEMQIKWGESQKRVEDLQKELKALIADKDNMISVDEVEKLQALLEKERIAKENLANSINTFEEEREAFAEKCETLKMQISDMEKESASGADEEVIALREKLQEQQDTNDDLHIINREMKDKVRRSTTEVEQMKREAEKAIEAKDIAQSKLEELEASRVAELEELTQQKDAIIEELTQEKDTAIEELKQEKESIVEELTKENEESLASLKSDMKAKMRVLEDQFADAVSERDRVEIELATAEQRLAEAVGAQSDQEKKIEELNETIPAFQKEIEELTEKASQLEEREKEIEELTTELTALKERYDASQEKARSFGETIDRLNEKVELLDSMSVELEAVKEKADKLDDAMAQIEMFEEAKDKADKERTELEEEKNRLQEGIIALEEKMSSQNEVLNTIAEALQRLEK